jgi:hypothetical protein
MRTGPKGAFANLTMSKALPTQSMKPVPSGYYRQRQAEFWRLCEIADGTARNAILSIQEELEAEFVRAWGLSDDTRGQSLEMKMMAARNCDGFDHCTFYYEAKTGSHVVVTQPYLEPAEVVEWLTNGLVVRGQIKPGIIAAPEWAFYYPGYATLIVVKFPPGYERILRALARLWSPAARSSLARN